MIYWFLGCWACLQALQLPSLKCRRQIQIRMHLCFSWSQVILVKTTVLCSCVWTTYQGQREYLNSESICACALFSCHIQEYELGSSLLEKCKQSQPMIHWIIETTTDDECMLFEALSLNEELQQIISKFDPVEICSKDPKETDIAYSASLQDTEASELGKW